MILDTVLHTLREHDALAPGALIIVAVSGGCDSVALLHLLKRLEDVVGVDLHVASLNHGIRAVAGQRDLDFVVNLASRWRLPYTVDHLDVPRLSAEWGIGIEEGARRARYRFLSRVAREQGSVCVAVGHHAGDQAETILMNIARGSGLGGLRGMRVVSQLPYQREVRLVRPLLRVSKQALQSYCHQRNLPYRTDETNADIGYSRNFVRHEIINRLTKLNPDVLGAFERLAESAAADEDFMASYFETAVMTLVKESADRWQIAKEDFISLHTAMKRRFLQAAYRRVSPEALALSHTMILDLIAWSQEARAGGRRYMSDVIQMRVSYDMIIIERRDAVEEHAPYRLVPAETDRQLVPGKPLKVGGLTIRLSPDRTAGGGAVNLRLPAKLKLRLRTRRPGDRFKPKGMGGRSRKIKRWMIDRKVPRELRDRIPLICADGDIIAICLGEIWYLADIADAGLRNSDLVTLALT